MKLTPKGRCNSDVEALYGKRNQRKEAAAAEKALGELSRRRTPLTSNESVVAPADETRLVVVGDSAASADITLERAAPMATGAGHIRLRSATNKTQTPMKW